MGPSYRSGPGFCPTINATESQEILVSSGIKKAIRVKVHIIGVSKKPTSLMIRLFFLSSNCLWNIIKYYKNFTSFSKFHF